METIGCNLCGSHSCQAIFQAPDAHYPSDEIFTVVRCNDCGLVFLNPRPTFIEMQKYYPGDYFRRFQETPDNMKRYRRRAKILTQLPVQSKRLLDVGCATGQFPRFMMRQGWVVEGVEVAQNSDIDDFHVYRLPFPEAPIAPERFDIVTMWGVLEHVHDPMSYLRAANHVLKKSGHLVVTTNNCDSLFPFPSSLYREDIPRHLYFFTEDSVRKLIETNGFQLVRYRYGRDILERDPHNWLFYLRDHLFRRETREQSGNWKKTRKQFSKENQLNPGLLSTTRYVLKHPLAALDTLLAPTMAYVEILLHKYGIVTYIAKRL